MEYFDILVVGGGPAGLTAALYARRAGKSVVLLEKEAFGGQIAAAPRVENYPGVAGISGAELADRLYGQAEANGVKLELEQVLRIEDEGREKTVVTDYGRYRCGAVILATGMRRRTLGLEGEDAMTGVSFCAVCDGAFYRGQDVAVCGGGDAALQEALFLSDLCRRVTVIHRRDTFRGSPALLEQLTRRENVTVLFNTVVTALEGGKALSGLRLENTRTGEASRLAAAALFEAVGQTPEKELSSSLVAVDDGGFIPAGETCSTERPGVFAAGDCRAKEVRQLTTACADGAVAALAACRYCDRLC